MQIFPQPYRGDVFGKRSSRRRISPRKKKTPSTLAALVGNTWLSLLLPSPLPNSNSKCDTNSDDAMRAALCPIRGASKKRGKCRVLIANLTSYKFCRKIAYLNCIQSIRKHEAMVTLSFGIAHQLPPFLHVRSLQRHGRRQGGRPGRGGFGRQGDILTTL